MTRELVLALVLLTAGVAGCIGGDAVTADAPFEGIDP